MNCPCLLSQQRYRSFQQQGQIERRKCPRAFYPQQYHSQSFLRSLSIQRHQVSEDLAYEALHLPWSRVCHPVDDAGTDTFVAEVTVPISALFFCSRAARASLNGLSRDASTSSSRSADQHLHSPFAGLYQGNQFLQQVHRCARLS